MNCRARPSSAAAVPLALVTGRELAGLERSITTLRCYAERGIVMPSCLSVCLSVGDVKVSWIGFDWIEQGLTYRGHMVGIPGKYFHG